MIAMIAKTTMKTNCVPTNSMFMRVSSRMPRMFSAVTSPTVRMIHSSWEVLGK